MQITSNDDGHRRRSHRIGGRGGGGGSGGGGGARVSKETREAEVARHTGVRRGEESVWRETPPREIKVAK